MESLPRTRSFDVAVMRLRVSDNDPERVNTTRRTRLARSAAISLQILVLTCRLAFGDDALKKELVEQEARLHRETTPIGKVKALIKISDIHLRFASRNKNDLAEADSNLELYKKSVKDALETLKLSRRNAQKNPAGFKEFEISLRKQLRVLDDLKSHYSFDQTKTIESAIAAAKEAQNAMFAELFGPENTGQRRERDPASHTDQPKE